MAQDIIKELRHELEKKGTKENREISKKFFKEPVDVYGLKSKDVRALAKKFFKQIAGEPKDKIFGYCETLWKSNKFEECFIACFCSEKLAPQYTKEDIRIFECWLDNYVTNWASCDTLCNHTIAMLTEKYPELIKYMKKWALSKNIWTRRGAAVTLIIPARKGLFLKDILEIADTLLPSPEDLVQKGYGWMLKAASEAYPKEVFDYLISKKKVMPRTAYRYALEKMPAQLRKKAMGK